MKVELVFRQKKLIAEMFKNSVGYKLNIENPKSFNEKMQWLKLYYHDPTLTRCADKYLVRSYVEENIGRKYLLDILGVYKKAEDIDFNNLPNKFVLKTNNGSGTNIVCTNKKKLNVRETIEKLNEWMDPRASHYFYSYEWCYKNIKPRIICEEYITTENDDLKDYKILCFNGRATMLFVCSDRKTNLKVDFFDINWNKLPFTRYYKNSTKKQNQPKCFKEMIEIAERLSKPFPFVRVDLYEMKNKPMFGELTFYPGNGMEPFNPKAWDYRIGKMLKLPPKRHPARFLDFQRI